jgi:hypothetical protein
MADKHFTHIFHAATVWGEGDPYRAKKMCEKFGRNNFLPVQAEGGPNFTSWRREVYASQRLNGRPEKKSRGFIV